MRKFKCEVERTDEFTIEFDESVMNDEWLKDFKDTFFDFDTLEEHAEYISEYLSEYRNEFIEGYGIPLENGKEPYWAEKKYINHAINIVYGDKTVRTNLYEKVDIP